MQAVRAVVVLLLVASCGEKPAPPVVHAALGGETVAKVGDSVIERSLVEAVAREQHRSADEALSFVVDDAVLAQAARAKKMDLVASVHRDLIDTNARLVADRIDADAKARGACTDAEVATLSELHKDVVDAPERVRVIHAIAIRPKKQDDSAIARVREVGEALRVATLGATSDEDFEARAKAVPHDGVDIRVEALPPFDEEGAIADGHGSMDATFAHAAYALAKPGDLSPLIETTFGFHVIRLQERIPAKRVPTGERRTMFADECVTRRSHDAIAALLAKKRAAVHVEIARDADEAMSAVLGAAQP
ncbi:MAG: peptidylprolyl isomerase [Polyangiaceae bacterium]